MIINKFILLLRKGFYLYKYMDNWRKFNETSLPEKEEFCSHLNIEDITDVDQTHVKICKELAKVLKQNILRRNQHGNQFLKPE